MNRLSKGILWVVGGLLALIAAAFVVLNLYLQSPGTQAQIQDAIGDALGTKIAITNTSLTPWSDLRINGIRIPAAEGGSGNFAEAPSFTARYRLMPLFNKKLVLPAMTLDAPKIAWRQNAEGRWIWPLKKKDTADQSRKNKRKGERLEGESAGFAVLIEALKVQGGAVELQNAEGAALATATGVNIQFSRLAAHETSGTMRIEKLVWGPLVFENVTSPFSMTEEGFELPELAAELAGGEARGSLKIGSAETDSPLAAKVSLSRVDLAKIASNAHWADGSMAGTLRGNVELRGTTTALARSEGRGKLELDRGQFRGNELFQTIGEVLAMEELVNLRLNSATAEFRIADEMVFIEPLTLATADLRLTAKGTVRFDNKLDLEARLAVAEPLAKRLPGFVRSSFSAPDLERMSAIDFKVTGRTDKPKTDLAEKLVSKKVGEEMQDLLNGLFGVRKKKDEKSKEEKKEKKKKSEKSVSSDPALPLESSAAVLAAPSPTPAPLPGQTSAELAPVEPSPVTAPDAPLAKP